MTHTLIFRVAPGAGSDELELVSAGPGPAAVAQGESGGEGGEGESEVGEELTEEIEEGDAEDEEVNNPILPTGPEIFWGAVTFLLLWALMKWVLLPPLHKVQDNRAERIRADRDAAERAGDEAARLRDEHRVGLANARAEATRLIDDARHAGEQHRAELISQAETEISQERAATAAEVDEAKQAALAELKSGVADMAVEAAQLVVQRDIDAASQAQAIEEYVNQAGSQL